MLERKDHINETVKLLPEQFRQSANLVSLIQLIANRILDVDNEAIDVAIQQKISTAQGWWLDFFGELLGIERSGESDDQYRARLISFARARTGSGDFTSIAEAIRLYTDPAALVSVREIFPAAFGVTIITSQPIPTGLIRLLKLLKAAAVELSYVATAPDADTFVFSGTSFGQGFGTITDSTTGGKLAGIV
jgi:hypothetical protein